MEKACAHTTAVGRESMSWILTQCQTMLWFNRHVLLLEAGFPMRQNDHVGPLAPKQRLLL